MIGDALRVEIERYVARARRDNRLLAAARAGQLTADDVGRYVRNVRHVLRYTPIHLAQARDAARARGLDALAAHYEHKRAEETGHDGWAEDDLGGLREGYGVDAEGDDALPSVHEHIARLDRVTRQEPTLYLAYILFAEYHVVLLGPELLTAIEQRCGIPQSMLSAVGHHVELDKDHVAEGIAEIDALVADPALLPRLRESLWLTMDWFERFCAELVERAEGPTRGRPAVRAHA